jgi:hypothetical protein
MTNNITVSIIWMTVPELGIQYEKPPIRGYNSVCVPLVNAELVEMTQGGHNQNEQNGRIQALP